MVPRSVTELKPSIIFSDTVQLPLVSQRLWLLQGLLTNVTCASRTQLVSPSLAFRDKTNTLHGVVFLQDRVIRGVLIKAVARPVDLVSRFAEEVVQGTAFI